MMQNMVPPQEHLPNDEITSPLGAQIFDFCESELFPETLQNSEVASSSNCCYEEHTSYQTPLPTMYNDTLENNDMPPPPPSGGGSGSPSTASARNTNLAMLLEEEAVDDISDSIDFSLSPSSFSLPHDQQYSSNQEPFAMPSMNNHNHNHNHNQLLGDVAAYAPNLYNPELAPAPVLGPTLPAGMKEDCQLPPPPPASYNIRLRSSSPACTLADPMMGSYLSSGGATGPPFSLESPWLLFTGGSNLLMGSDFSNQELESQGDNGGYFLPDSLALARVFNCSNGDLQTLSSSESQHMVNGSPSTTLASDISSLEDPSIRPGKLSAEERKRKIHRYLKKRNERNFSKKIKYACRKTLADSRPRVRGRFAKNDELGELARNAGNNQDDDVDEDVNQMFRNSMPDHHHKGVKEEDGMDPSELFAHINEVNSFKCNYPIQSWI